MPQIILKFLLKHWPHVLGLLGLIASGLMLYNAGRTAGEEAVQARWDKAIAAAQVEAEKVEAEHARIAQEMQDELQAKLAAANGRSRDLARRLSNYEDAIRRMPPPAGPAPGPHGADAQPGDTGEIERLIGRIRSAREELDAACAREEAGLTGWQGFWRQVSE